MRLSLEGCCSSRKPSLSGTGVSYIHRGQEEFFSNPVSDDRDPVASSMRPCPQTLPPHAFEHHRASLLSSEGCWHFGVERWAFVLIQF